MKTNQELLDFYKVELKKKYKIIKSRKCPEHFVEKMFIVKEKLNTKDLYLEIIDKCKCGSVEMLSWFDYEEVKEPLTDKEKEYLSAVIRPFRDQIVYIAKNFTIFTNSQYIGIYIKDQDTTYLPMFPEGKYYKGMEVNKEYTLEDLGL